jgi:hypothetical protein
MKWIGPSIVALALLMLSSLDRAPAQERSASSSKDKVVKLPANIVEVEYNTDGKTRTSAALGVRPLDELSAQGWELISALQGEGGEFVCFPRQRRDSHN